MESSESTWARAYLARPTLQHVLLAAIGILIARLLQNKFRYQLRNIPGPTLASYTSLWRLYDVCEGQAHKTAIELHRKHGSLVRIGPKHVSVSDPREIANIYGLNKGYTKVRSSDEGRNQELRLC